MIQADLNVILPEIVLSVYAMLALLAAVYTAKDELAGLLTWITAGVFAALAFYIATSGGTTVTAFGGMFIDDGFARFAKVMILLSAAAVLAMSQGYLAARGLLKFEYPLLIALATVGMMMMVSAGDLMALYMGLELQSLALYVVAALRRDSVKSTEAGLKYFVLGALSSGLLLYGASLVYGFAGTTQFAGVILAASGETSLGLLFGLVFLISGLAFKVSAVPFHMWTPDVYEGSPTPVTAFFATAPKVAAMALFARVLHDAFGGVTGDWQQIIALLSVLSMFLGAVAAIGQTNIKRLMAYSSIGHVGYALIGLAVGGETGVASVLIYLAIYMFMNLGTFACILCMRRADRMVEGIDDLAGLGKTHPMLALGIVVFMFSMAGIPPLGGWFAKFEVFRVLATAGEPWGYALAIVGAVNSVVALYYYASLARRMWADDPVDGDLGPVPVTPSLMSALTLCGVVTLVFGVVPQVVARFTDVSLLALGG